MTNGEISKSIRKSWDLVSRLKIGRSFSIPVSLKVNEEFRDIALDPGAAYEEVYLTGLKKSHYNFILSDSSYFQYSLHNISTRYVFFPNPYQNESDLDTDELERFLEEGVLSFEEYADLLADKLIAIKAPPFRYEFAPDQYKEISHPCSHFHIGHHDRNRWPASRRLTPLAFTMLMMRAYYPSQWAIFDDTAHEYYNSLNRDLAEEKKNCTELDQYHFSDKEKSLFYFL